MKGRILHLTLKKKWFDMIASGKKREEYREVKDYWMKRLAGLEGCGTSYNFSILNDHEDKCLKYDYIIFKNGYAKTAPSFKIECKGITVGLGKPKWGAPNHMIFVIKLGKIIN